MDHIDGTPVFTVSALARMFEITQPAMTARLKGLEPDAIEGRRRYFTLMRVLTYTHTGGGSQGEMLDQSYERARVAKEQADKLAMDNQERFGALVPVEVYEMQCATDARQLTSLLDIVPLRLKQTLPHLSAEDIHSVETTLSELRSGFYKDVTSRTEQAA